MDFYRILYSSKASDAMKSSDVMNIIATAQAFNKTADVTGMLLFIEDGFIQYLEGAEETVVKLYKKLHRTRVIKIVRCCCRGLLVRKKGVLRRGIWDSK